MTDFFNALLRLDSSPIRPGGEGVQFAFAVPLAPWMWAAAALVTLLIAAAAYRRIEGSVVARAALAGCRAVLLLLLLVLACGPRLQKPNESVEKDWVIVLADRSASLAIADAPTGNSTTATDPAPPSRQSRETQLRAALRDHRAIFDRLAADRVLLWQGFDAGMYDLKPPITEAVSPGDGLPVTLADPTGVRTNLAGAIEQALQRAAARPLAGIVVLSDGRSNDQPSRELLRRLAAEKTPVIGVPLGSADPVGDAAVRSVTGPGVAFPGDVVPIEAVVEHVGGFSRTGTDRVARVQLVDAATGEVLDEKPIEWKPASTPEIEGSSGATSAPAPAPSPTHAALTQRITLTTTPTIPGRTQFTVRVLPGGGPDLVIDNNQAAVGVELVDRPLRVAYFDGYPRWEYRFLQAVLTREKSIASTAMLVAPGKRYIQEGNTPLDAVPASPGEWEPIDAIVIGDVQPDAFSSDQLRQIRQRVAAGGAGLLWIAGEGAVPTAWRGTPLADLLPINLESGETLRAWDRDVVLRPAPAADRLGVLRLLRLPQAEQTGASAWWPPDVGDPRAGWSRIRWAQRLEPANLKPAAEVLATAHAIIGDDAAPLVLSMRYGAGRILYVGTDEIWRWRFGRGEDLPERFWLQLIRLLGRDSVSRAGKPAILTATPSRAEVGQPVRLQAEIIDQSLAESVGSSLTLRVERLGGPGDSAPTPPHPTDIQLRTPGTRSAGDRAVFNATWVPAGPGRFRLSLVDGPLAAAGIFTDAEVWLADDELRRPETDHGLLSRLAKESGGTVIAPTELNRLPDLLPRREVRITLAPDEHELWDTPLALILILLLLTTEWIGRRVMRMA